MSISERLLKIKESLPEGVTLVAVSKYHPEEELMEAYAAGQRVFGENIVQELVRKQASLPKDIAWHFIGHLQRNKVKYIAPFVSLIHAVDSLDLLREIDRQAKKHNRTIPCLLQVHIAEETTKFGFTAEACEAFVADGEWRGLENVEIHGLMCIATHSDDVDKVRKEFRQMKSLFFHLKETAFNDAPFFNLCSWGMSEDYEVAIGEGSNMVRIGTSIFGQRPVKRELPDKDNNINNR